MSADRARLWAPPLWLGALWGFAEATLFFIIPDVSITWAALGDVRQGVRMLGVTLAGAILGGLVIYTLAVWQPDTARSIVDAVPFVRPWMFDRVAAAYAESGAAGILYAPGNGIPYKVYAALAPDVAGPVTFALLSVPARLLRFLPGWLIATAVGWGLRRWIRGHARTTGLVFAALWIAGYAAYWVAVSAR